MTLPSAIAAESDAEIMLKKRHNMVRTQIERRGIRNPRVLQVMKDLPRHHFVPEPLSSRAYEDNPLPIGYDQTISQPFIVAYMTSMLKVEPHHRVLEIGTGSGYQAAVLSKLVKSVYSIEIVEPIYNEAERTLKEIGISNVHLKLGDGWKGWPEEAPFDRILVTAAPEHIPPALIEQLKDGGRLVVPVGRQKDNQVIQIGVKQGGIFKTTDALPVRFVPLVREETA